MRSRRERTAQERDRECGLRRIRQLGSGPRQLSGLAGSGRGVPELPGAGCVPPPAGRPVSGNAATGRGHLGRRGLRRRLPTTQHRPASPAKCPRRSPTQRRIVTSGERRHAGTPTQPRLRVRAGCGDATATRTSAQGRSRGVHGARAFSSHERVPGVGRSGGDPLGGLPGPRAGSSTRTSRSRVSHPGQPRPGGAATGRVATPDTTKPPAACRRLGGSSKDQAERTLP